MKSPKLLIGSILLFSTSSVLAHDTFVDLSSNHPHSTAIDYVYHEGIVSGYPDNTFRSKNQINRVELLKILMESKYPDQAACKKLYNYSDVDWNYWYGPYIQQASCLEIVKGNPNGTFRPADTVNAAEAFKMISETFELTTSSNSEIWYEGYTNDLINQNAIPTDVTSINSPLNRGQVAEMIYRIHGNVQNLPTQTYSQLTNPEETTTEQTEDSSLTPYCSDIACNSVEITTDENYRYIQSNGIPNHETGKFPTRGNPNSVLEQNHSYRLPLSPIKTDSSTSVRIAGVALNGVPFEPKTAETFDKNDDWAIEAFDANGIGGLGIDAYNAHVQPNGTYHYHALPVGLKENISTDSDLILMGWAADGFPIYYSQSNAYQSSWQLKPGNRPNSGPEGTYDGTYTQDFEFVADSGNLDRCNGITINREYKYIITQHFPFVQRCVFGTPDPSFDRKLQDNRGLPGMMNPNLGTDSSDDQSQKQPPQGAIDACDGNSSSDSCEINAPRGTITGTCQTTQSGVLACVPN